MDFAQQVAESFDVDFVIDTGDITSFGTPIENLIATKIPGFERPYLFVRGSHDSIALQAEVAQVPNAIVLDGQAETIDGLTVYGLGHPAFTPARGAPVDAEDVRGARAPVGPGSSRIWKRPTSRSASLRSTTTGWPRTSPVGCRW